MGQIMEPSAKLLSRMDDDVRELVRICKWVEPSDTQKAMRLGYKLLSKQLKAEQDRAKENSPFYSLHRHVKLLVQMQLLKIK